MILYKYYGYNSGLAALQSRRLGFRDPNCFNDPLELSFPIAKLDSKDQWLSQSLEILRKWVVILSLTKNPVDWTMWAHYGENHAGFVIGYEAADPFLDDPRYNLITAGNGAVSYRAPVSSDLTALVDEQLIRQFLHFGLGAELDGSTLDRVRDFAKLAFLTKHPRWKSEDEVRVIKLIASAFEETADYQSDPLRQLHPMDRLVAPNMACALVPGLKLYKHQVSIREVYLGARNPHLRAISNADDFDPALTNAATTQQWRIKKVTITPDSWEPAVADIGPEALSVPRLSRGLTQCLSFDAETAQFIQERLSRVAIEESDRYELTTWNGEHYLKRSGRFL